MSPGASQDEKAAAFRALHEGESFLISNPWDAGSARVLEALGFKALATYGPTPDLANVTARARKPLRRCLRHRTALRGLSQEPSDGLEPSTPSL